MFNDVGRLGWIVDLSLVLNIDTAFHGPDFLSSPDISMVY